MAYQNDEARLKRQLSHACIQDLATAAIATMTVTVGMTEAVEMGMTVVALGVWQGRGDRTAEAAATNCPAARSHARALHVNNVRLMP